MGFFARQTKSNRMLLIIKLAAMALAFILLAVLSYLFMGASIRNSIALRAESIHELTADRITTTLLEYESTLDSYANDICAMLEQGENAAGLRSYLDSISHYRFMDGNAQSGINNFFGYFETIPEGPQMIHSSYWSDPEGYIPEQQNWYKLAMEANGATVETVPLITDNDETLFIYAKAIFDEQGRRLGIVCMSVKIDSVGQKIVETSLHQGGYGILINEDDIILFHPNPDFRGRSMHDPVVPLSLLAEEINNGDVYEVSMVAYRGDKAVGFFTKLYNGWHLGLVTPEAQYFKGLTGMGILIVLIALAFAAIFIAIMVKLDAAREKSDEESRQKSAFLANMSHEIRTPINAIVGMTAIGRTAGTTERMGYCFAKIDDASRHLLGVVNDILDMSKIEANKIELAPTDFSFEKMLQQVTNIINFRMDEKHQKLAVQIDKDIPKILYADDYRLTNIITNLLSNAIKFSPENSTIRLNADSLGEADGVYSIQIKVADEGIGISPEQQAELFKPFQQAEASTTRRYGGTGLGLVISKSIVEMMGGRIWVESELGHGSTFAFIVKVKRGDDSKCGLKNNNINWGNIRILTVDDDEYILDYFREIMKGFGAECSVAANADEALRLIDESSPYNVYFVDMKMPGIDGISLTRAIKARMPNPEQSVVVMISSSDYSEVEQEARKAGADKFLLKPIFPSAIADTVSECIGIVNERFGDTAEEIDGLFAGRHILLVDDVEINREIVLVQLEPTQAAIDCAENGEQAAAMFQQEPEKYDLIFMDIQMPVMDGYDATEKIRELGTPQAKQIPIIAMTANVFKEDVERCLAAGMNAHIGKPIDFDEMIRILKEKL